MNNEALQEARILIIDDEDLHVELLTRTLADHGYRYIRSITDPRQTLQTFRDFQPDLIILDWFMPEIGGQQVLQQLRGVIPLTCYLPILVVTGAFDGEIKRNALENGANDFLTKPFDSSEIALRVDSLARTRLLLHKLEERQEELEKRVAERTSNLAEANAALEAEVATRKDAEAAIFFASEDWEQCFNAIPAHLSILDPTGKIVRANQTMRDRFEPIHGNLVGLDYRVCYCGTATPDVQPPCAAVLSGAPAVVWEGALTTLEGWFGIASYPLFDKERKQRGAVSVVRDMTARKQAEAELRISEAKYRSLTDSIGDAIVSADETGNIVFWNPSAERLFGYRADEILGKPLTMIMPERYREMHLVGLARYQAGGEARVIGRTVELPGLRKDGSEFHTELTIATWETGHATFYAGILRDITERVQSQLMLQKAHVELEARVIERTVELKEANKALLEEVVRRRAAEEARQRSEEKLSLAIAGADLGTWDWNPAAGQIEWSDRKKAMFGLSAETAMTYELFAGSVHPDDRTEVEAALQRALQQGDQYDVEYRIIRPDGSVPWIAERGRAVRNAEGQAISISGTAQDISTRKHAEENLTQARQEAEQANRAKSDFLSRMSHELRTPLNAILGFAQVLEMNQLEGQPRDCVTHILKAGTHLLGLINEVLDLSGIEAGRVSFSIEAVKVQEVVHECVELIRPLANARGQRLDSPEMDAAEPHVLADRQRLKQIILNILANAVKYNHHGGSAKVSWQEHGVARFRISVEDTGPGIPPGKIGKLFSPFERLGAELTQTEGSGLGLALCKNLIEAMGGEIGADSVAGKGSIFWLDLPRSQSPLARVLETGTTPSFAVAVSAGTILYIEDNLSNLALIEYLLSQLPQIKLLAAMQGSLGIELAEQHRPDLILLDLHLPDIMGDEVLARLKSNAATRNIPVAMLTADATPAQEARLLAAGADHYLTKPIDVPRLLHLIEDRLGSRTSKN